MKQADYPIPELQAAYDDGRRIGRTEGVIIYQRHLIENLQKENAQLNKKLEKQKGGKAMREQICLKSEREILITAIRDLVTVKQRLCDFVDGGSEVSKLYSSKLLDVDIEISHLCGNLGDMVGYTVYSDICEGLEVLP